MRLRDFEKNIPLLHIVPANPTDATKIETTDIDPDTHEHKPRIFPEPVQPPC